MEKEAKRLKTLERSIDHLILRLNSLTLGSSSEEGLKIDSIWLKETRVILRYKIYSPE